MLYISWSLITKQLMGEITLWEAHFTLKNLYLSVPPKIVDVPKGIVRSATTLRSFHEANKPKCHGDKIINVSVSRRSV